MSERVLIAGASGLVGQALKAKLQADGFEVHTLVRREPVNETEHRWNPADGFIGETVPTHFRAVVNLSGASIGRLPWTAAYKRELVSSRVSATQTLANHLREDRIEAEVFVSASASGYYGNRGTEELDESSAAGSGFLASLCEQWEGEAAKASKVTRVVYLRTGVVLAKTGGALGKLLPLIKLGVGGPLGSGKQWWPWITLADEVSAIAFLINSDDAHGAYNLCAPDAASCGEITEALGASLKRPTWLAVPEFALRLLLGITADEVLLCSTKMVPARLLESEFQFEHSRLDQAISYITKK